MQPLVFKKTGPDPFIKFCMYMLPYLNLDCISTYLFQVGFFGYVAFCEEPLGGDVLMSFQPTIFSEAIKLGFVLSVAVSFPLCIFPCRASINTLLFSQVITALICICPDFLRMYKFTYLVSVSVGNIYNFVKKKSTHYVSFEVYYICSRHFNDMTMT